MAVNARTLTLLRKLATQVGATADDTVRELTSQWLAGWTDLTPAWQAAIAAILDQYARAGVWPAPWQTARIEAVTRAQQHTEASLTLLLTAAAATTVSAAAAVSAATAATEPEIIAAQLPPTTAVTGVAGVVAVTAVAAALAARKQRITALHTAAVTDALAAVRRVFVRPPDRPDDANAAAAELTARARTGFDAAATRAATVARTELIDTYRDVAAAVHQANRRHVTGWAWMASRDRRCCPSCWAMHGTRHPLDQPGPQSHPGCRCLRVPLVGDADLPSAESRFRRLPRRDQIAIMGPARLALLRSGAIDWASLATLRTHNGWRPAVQPRTVRDLQLLADRRAA